MLSPNTATFFADVYDIVAQIPHGKVLTYGRIAALCGWPQHSRLAGRAMKEAPNSLKLPCHRIVNAAGRTADSWPEQAALLREEGVSFRPNGCVDLAKTLWQLEFLIPNF